MYHSITWRRMKKIIEAQLKDEKELLETIEVLLWDRDIDPEDVVKCSFCNQMAKLQYLPHLEENAKPLLFACIDHFYDFTAEIRKREGII